MSKNSKTQNLYVAARDVSVPIIVIRTADAALTTRALAAVTVDAENRPAPVVQWDVVRGFTAANPLNAQGSQAAAVALGADKSKNALTALIAVANACPPNTAVIMHNLDAFWTNDAQVRQAVWNLRDILKKHFRTLVCLQVEGGVPMQLEHDVYMIDEPLPTTEELAVIARNQYKAAQKHTPELPDPSEEDLVRIADACAGLSGFAAEQAQVLSLRKRGMDFIALRQRHRTMIENTKGLSVWAGTETLDQVGGLKAAKSFLRKFKAAGRYNFKNVFWIDELEKALGAKGDLTGITQDYIGVILAYMADNRIPGILLMGHPGCGKSHLAKSFASMVGVPCIRADLGAMQGSLVGQSQHAIRHALKVQHSVAQGLPLFVATCNNVAVLPAELTNRFVWRFFVDLPDDDEKAAIWDISLARLGLDAKQKRPNDFQWNGREIDQCCMTAWQLNTTIVDAAKYIVPIAQSSAEEIERRRQAASGRYLSASHDGAFGHEPQEEVQVGDRRVRLKDGDVQSWSGGSGKMN